MDKYSILNSSKTSLAECLAEDAPFAVMDLVIGGIECILDIVDTEYLVQIGFADIAAFIVDIYPAFSSRDSSCTGA